MLIARDLTDISKPNFACLVGETQWKYTKLISWICDQSTGVTIGPTPLQSDATAMRHRALESWLYASELDVEETTGEANTYWWLLGWKRLPLNSWATMEWNVGDYTLHSLVFCLDRYCLCLCIDCRNGLWCLERLTTVLERMKPWWGNNEGKSLNFYFSFSFRCLTRLWMKVALPSVCRGPDDGLVEKNKFSLADTTARPIHWRPANANCNKFRQIRQPHSLSCVPSERRINL